MNMGDILPYPNDARQTGATFGRRLSLRDAGASSPRLAVSEVGWTVNKRSSDSAHSNSSRPAGRWLSGEPQPNEPRAVDIWSVVKGPRPSDLFTHELLYKRRDASKSGAHLRRLAGALSTGRGRIPSQRAPFRRPSSGVAAFVPLWFARRTTIM